MVLQLQLLTCSWFLPLLNNRQIKTKKTKRWNGVRSGYLLAKIKILYIYSLYRIQFLWPLATCLICFNDSRWLHKQVFAWCCQKRHNTWIQNLFLVLFYSSCSEKSAITGVWYTRTKDHASYCTTVCILWVLHEIFCLANLIAYYVVQSAACKTKHWRTTVNSVNLTFHNCIS